MILRKSITIKEVTDKGVVVCKFAEMNCIDKDGDITLPGFFGKQSAIMLPAHDWKHVPMGKGNIFESGNDAIAEMQMNLEIPAAKDWHSWLKFDMAHGKPEQEYSYGFTVLDGGSSDGGEVNGAKAYRTLRPRPDGSPGCIVHEVSPCVVGAGSNTGTHAVKELKFADQAEASLVAVTDMVQRARSLADLRAKENRTLSAVNKERLETLMRQLKELGVLLESLNVDETARAQARAELNRALRLGVGNLQ